MQKFLERIFLSAAPFAASLLLRLLALTLKFRQVGRPELNKGERAIFAFWHGRMLMMPFIRPDGPFTVMVSRHRDGELISRTVKWLGIGSSRGSTTRGGASALKDILRLARGGYNIAFTPDGPKGPKFTVQPGVLQAAKATGLPVYPVTYGALKKKLLNPGTVL